MSDNSEQNQANIQGEVNLSSSSQPAQASQESLAEDQGQAAASQFNQQTAGQEESSPPPPWVGSEEGAAGPPSEPAAPVEGEIRQSVFKKIVPFLGLLILAAGLFFLISKIILPMMKKIKGGGGELSGQEVTLTYWGLWEPESVMSSLIADYQKSHPQVKINYSRQSHKDYRERLQSALAREEGPDIFRFHNTWLPMMKKELAPLPPETAQSLNLSGNFYPVVSSDLKIESKFYGVPLEFDALSLFYNTKIFQTAGKKPPASWEELRRTALDLTVRDGSGRIEVAGVALGTTNNVDHFSDILGLMMLQNGVDLKQPSGSLGEDALRFYSLFVNTDRVWDSTLPSSTYAFATGKVAMFFAPSWRVHDVSNINPDLGFKTAPVPQLPDTKVAWATFWVEGVSLKSKHQKEAWEFLSYMASKETLKKFYNNAAKVRGFGEPYPRKDMAQELEDDPLVGSFVKQGSYAQSWYLCSRTHDNGLNDKMIKYFEDAVNSVVQRKSASKALITVAQGVSQILGRYGIQ